MPNETPVTLLEIPSNGKQKTMARKVKILRSAAKIFTRKGFHEGTIPDIAREAGVSEASIYGYFSTKEGLLFSIPTEAIQQLEETIRFHLKLIKGCVNKLRAMLYLQLAFYSENPEFAAVIMLILKQNRRFLNTEGHKAIRSYISLLDHVIQEGMDAGELRNDIDLYLLRSASIGAMEHVVTNWVMLDKKERANLLDLVEPLIDVFIEGVRNKKPDNSSACPFLKQPIPADQTPSK